MHAVICCKIEDIINDARGAVIIEDKIAKPGVSRVAARGAAVHILKQCGIGCRSVTDPEFTAMTVINGGEVEFSPMDNEILR